MFFLILTIDQNIVQISHTKDIQIVKKRVVYKPLKSGRSIYGSELEHLWFVVSKWSTECQEVLILRSCDLDAIKCLPNVKLCHDLAASDTGHSFLNKRNRILIFLCDCIEFSVINI